MKFRAAGLTDPGQVRKNNEDNYWVDVENGLLIVADGMGGHASGEVASQMAVDVIGQQVETGLKTGKIPSIGDKLLHLSDRSHLVTMSVRMANEVIHETAAARVQNKGMGTTIVAVLLNKKNFSVAHVGDSRLYLFRGGALRQITRDHSLVAEQVAKGVMTEAQAEASDLKNVLTRALGVGPDVEVDTDEHAVQAGDLLLLCTDGLCRMATDDEIAEVLKRVTDPLEICQTLVKLANDKGGRDNITVVAGRVEDAGFVGRLTGLFKKA